MDNSVESDYLVMHSLANELYGMLNPEIYMYIFKDNDIYVNMLGYVMMTVSFFRDQIHRDIIKKKYGNELYNHIYNIDNARLKVQYIKERQLEYAWNTKYMYVYFIDLRLSDILYYLDSIDKKLNL